MSYLHLRGTISVGEPDFAGTFGILLPGEQAVLEAVDNVRVRDALRTLRDTNPLYSIFLPRVETVLGHFPLSNQSTDQSCVPLMDTSLLLEMPNTRGEPSWLLPDTEIEGASLPRNEAKHHVLGLQSTDSGETPKLKQDDPQLEEKLFPALFPTGQGGWNSETKDALSFSSYLKMRLRSVDPRWRQDPKWILFNFDRAIKSRVFAYNSVHVSAAGGTKAANLKGDGYNERSRVMPNNIQGSKKTWERHHQDLLAILRELGRPRYFVTLTLNEGDPAIQAVLRGRPARDCPVEVTQLFFERFDAVKPLLFGDNAIYGKVVDYWYRVEFQNRGAPHLHIIVWVSPEHELPVDQVVYAIIPPENDPELRDLVQHLQIHKCTARCARKVAKKAAAAGGEADDLAFMDLLETDGPGVLALEEEEDRVGGAGDCKYGFPFAPQMASGFDELGSRFLFARGRHDAWVVSYSPVLTLAWRAHHNVAFVTDAALSKYLAKYISKMEPAIAAKYAMGDDVDRYLNMRVLSVPEAVTYTLQYHVVQSTREVVFINTNMAATRVRKLKKKAVLQEMALVEPDSTDVFCPTIREFYCERPHDVEDVTLYNYVRDYGVVSRLEYLPAYAREDHDMDFGGRILYLRNKKVW